MEKLSTVPATALATGLTPDEHDLLAALLTGDEQAFGQLVDRYFPAMLQVARGFVRTPSAAQEVVQEALLAVVEGLPRFEGRSSLQTWMFRILVNRAKTRGAREGHRVSFGCRRGDRGSHRNDSVLPESTSVSIATGSSTIDPTAPVLNQELGEAICAAVDRLPADQHTVLVLRDIQGWTSPQVCEVLGLSDAKQRILLHRARTGVHARLLRSLNCESALIKLQGLSSSPAA
jgi:RNA polymerase sigma-70 factor (ECF subfamily)